MDKIRSTFISKDVIIFLSPPGAFRKNVSFKGHLRFQGHSSPKYKCLIHSNIEIIVVDVLKKGLVRLCKYQVIMNGMRFGLYQKIVDSGVISNEDGSMSSMGVIIAGASVGITGALIGSPFYLVKTQLQSQSSESIAVGFQHQHKGTIGAFIRIAKEGGVRGLWRGATTSIPSVGVGSATQLLSFSKTKELVDNLGMYPRDSWQGSLVGALVSGFAVACMMCPFDVVRTRVYNQATNSDGKGLTYNGYTDCLKKIFKTEGLFGFYKGWTTLVTRLAPHSFLNLLFWQYLLKQYKKYQE
ncbi:unnamed protein product, partial [Meganyctiphanes norvegica]